MKVKTDIKAGGNGPGICPGDGIPDKPEDGTGCSYGQLQKHSANHAEGVC